MPIKLGPGSSNLMGGKGGRRGAKNYAKNVIGWKAERKKETKKGSGASCYFQRAKQEKI